MHLHANTCLHFGFHRELLHNSLHCTFLVAFDPCEIPRSPFILTFCDFLLFFLPKR